MSEVNVPLLRKAVEWAEAEAQKPAELCEWDQRYYSLPTVEQYRLNDEGDPGHEEELDFTRRTLGKSPKCGACFCIAGYTQYVTTGSLNHITAFDAAQAALGITRNEARELFFAGNTIEDVRRISEAIAGEKL